MKRVPVRSSNIASAGYDQATEMLEIEFKSSGVYQYEGVPLKVFRGLLTQKSSGRFFRRRVLGRYPYTKVEEKEKENNDGVPT